MNYNEIVSSLRTAARDMLRMKLTNQLRDELLGLTNHLAAAQKDHETTTQVETKRIAVANYQSSLVADADPEAEEKRARYAAVVENSTKFLADRTAMFQATEARLLKEIEELNARIAKVQSGETKVDKGLLSDATSHFIQEVADEAVKSRLAEEIAKSVEAPF